jgi:PAS domain S-box-containing protein
MLSKLGYTTEEITRMSVLDLHPEESRKEAQEIIERRVKGETDTSPLPLKCRDGAIIPVDTRAWMGKWDGKDCIYGISKDLSKEQEALQKFEKLFSRNPALMAVSEQKSGRFTDVNYAFLDILGYSYEEVIGKTSADLGLFENPEEQYKLKHQLRTTGRIVNCELKVRCKSGKILDGMFSGEILESHGEKSFLTVMVDMTGRRHAEEKLRNSLQEKEILLKEIHHRVKNNLQAISSLMSLKMNHFKEPQLREAFLQMKNRIRSMAMVHEKLYTSQDIALIDFGDHIKSIANELFIAYGNDAITLEVEADRVLVELEKAVPLSLILNELVSNALIHAFPGPGTGMLQIHLKKSGNEAIALIIRDNGKGFPDNVDLSETSTLGLTLINALIHQIDATIELSKDNGTTFTIKFDTADRT